MKRVIRANVFETNSSTSHSVIIMTEESFKKWKEENGSFIYSRSSYWDPFEELAEDERPEDGGIYSENEVRAFIKRIGEDYAEDDYSSFEKFAEEYHFYSYEGWFYDEYLESDTSEYKTPGGESIVVCCKYGNDY